MWNINNTASTGHCQQSYQLLNQSLRRDYGIPTAKNVTTNACIICQHFIYQVQFSDVKDTTPELE